MSERTNIDVFKSILNVDSGLSRQARFICTILPSGQFGLGDYILRELPFLCTDAEIPGESLNTADIQYYGPSFKLPYQPVYNDLVLTFIMRANHRERKFFHNWIRYIKGNGSNDMHFRNEYDSIITIETISEVDPNPTLMTATFQHAYPVNVSPVPMSWADDGFLRMQVQFSYTEHRIE